MQFGNNLLLDNDSPTGSLTDQRINNKLKSRLSSASALVKTTEEVVRQDGIL